MDKEMLVNYLKAKPDLNLFLNNVIEDKTILDSLFDIVATETSSIKYVCTKIKMCIRDRRNAAARHRVHCQTLPRVCRELSLIHIFGVTVEGELGVLAGVEDHVFSETSTYTNPLKAIEFFKKTGCDALAISYGTCHLSLIHISQTVGYDNLSYFSSIFHDRTGLQPGEYRRKYRKG